MFYTVNHTMHSLHTVRPGSSTEQKLTQAQAKNGRRVIKIGADKHSAFESSEAAASFQVLLFLHGGQQ